MQTVKYRVKRELGLVAVLNMFTLGVIHIIITISFEDSAEK